MRRLSRAARVAGGVALLGLGLVGAEAVRAHPMPNTVIAVSLGDGGAVFDIAIPVRELRLALPGPVSPTASLLDEPLRTTTSRYLEAHCRVLSPTGASVPVTVLTLDLWDALDANVGQYQELRARLRADASGGVNPRDFLLAYDAVIHQIPNHFALVEIIRDFRAGVVAETDAVEVGVIRYDFRTKLTPPLRITAAPAGLWPGVRSVTALGFHHVAAGYDHLLFLLTLLIVAPLRPVGARWSLFQGWRYTLRRFLAISIAFTLGHSAALLAGVYELVPVPRAAIEVLIALSILITALHALRPIFSGREWLVAMLFGTVHGLAFAESLGALALTPGMRAMAVAGFNLGVEGAQLVAMACALPLLAASRWRGYHLIRTALMVSAVVLATWWMIDRGTALVASTSNTAAIDARVRAAMAETRANGMAIAVIDKGRVAYVQAYGTRNAKGDPLQTDTVMYGASLTKTVMAYTTLTLVDQHTLDLDTPLASYLERPLTSYGEGDAHLAKYGPYRDLASDERWRAITARMALTHSTGFHNFWFIEPDQKLRIHFDPGSRFSYSGEGFSLLQFVIEQGARSKGLGLDVKALTGAIFARLGMTRTSLQWRPDFRPNLADGWNDKGEPLEHDERSNVRVAGSMDTTISDLSKFVAALVRGDGLSPAARAEMVKPSLHIGTAHQFPNFGTPLPEAQQRRDLAAGLGVIVFDGPQGRGFYKGGHDAQTANSFVCLERGQRCVLLLANDVRMESRFADLVRFVLGDTGVPYDWEYGDQAGKS